MKLPVLISLLGLLVATASAVASQKAVIVSYPNETPDFVVNQAMDAIREAGGIVTHEYKLFKGFAAKASAKVLETVSAMGEKYPPLIEEDVIVSVSGEIADKGRI